MVKYCPVLFFAFMAFSNVAFAITCSGNSTHLKKRQEELKKIFDDDQADRTNFETMHDDQLEKMVVRDRIHLKTLNQISEEDCLTTAADYLMAAKVMMHMGKSPNLLKAFLWAKKSHDLGNNSKELQRTLAQSIDRYLVNRGFKQLFATQARQDSDARCWCLNPVEDSFPDALRVEYGGRDLDGAQSWVAEMNHGLGCHSGRYCKDHLKSAPKGTAPGIW